MKKRYKLESGLDTSITLEIDTDKTTEETVREINAFWNGGAITSLICRTGMPSKLWRAAPLARCWATCWTATTSVAQLRRWPTRPGGRQRAKSELRTKGPMK